MLPLVPYAMLFGALAMAAGLIWLPLGQLVALLAWPFLHWLIVVSSVLAQVPGAYATLPPFSVWWVWGWYLLITLWYLRSVPATSSPMTDPRGWRCIGDRIVINKFHNARDDTAFENCAAQQQWPLPCPGRCLASSAVCP